MANFCSECGSSLSNTARASASPTKSSSKAAPKRKRQPSAYSKRYGKAFKSLSPKYKKKSGGWKKDGFVRAQRAAHKAARK